MGRFSNISPLARAIGVTSAVVVISGGATFAALQGTAKLTDNSISALSSSSESLLVNNTKDNQFNDSEAGFKFNNIDPGSYSNTKNFKLRNTSSDPVDVNVQITGEPPLPSGVDGSEVHFRFICNNGGSTVTKTWSQLIAAPGVRLINNLDAHETSNCTVQVKIDNSVTEDNIDISGFDFTFTARS